MKSHELLEWLRAKLIAAEHALSAREQAAECWKSGTNKSWAESAKMHPSTAKLPPLTKRERAENARREDRIALKCKHDVEMFKAAIKLCSGED